MTHETSAVLGVDFGTTNTVVALADHGGVRVVLVDGGESLMPSCVVLSDEGLLLAGRTAQRMAATAPDRFVAHPKLHVDEDAVSMGGREVPVWAVIGAVFHRVVEAVVAQVGSLPPRVVLTHPAGWSGPRLEVLRAAARHGGLGEVELLPEPVAAAVHHAHWGRDRLTPGSTVAVYDLGGGTFDVAVLAVQQAAPCGPPAAPGRSLRLGHLDLLVLADRGDDRIGGAHFDDLVLSELAARHREDAPEVWAGIGSPVTATDRRYRRQLLEDVRATKEGLSETTSLALPLPGQEGDALLTRADLEDLIRPDIEDTVEIVHQALRDARVDPARLAAVYTVGGSSRIPLVSNTLLEAFGIAPTAVGHPEQTVALGAAVAPPLQQSDPVVVDERRAVVRPERFTRRHRTALIAVGTFSTVVALAAAALAAFFLLGGGPKQHAEYVRGASTYRSSSGTVVRWDPYDGAASYQLSRYPDDGGASVLTTVGTTYTDAAAPDDAYHYELVALAADGDALSRETWVSVDPAPTPTAGACGLSDDECALVAALPSDVVDKSTCTSDTVASNQVAAVRCEPAGGAATVVYAQRYTSADALRADLSGRQPDYVSADAPTCSDASTEGYGEWNENQVVQGNDACFLDDGHAWMEWGYDAARIRIQASDSDPSSVSGIVAWWSDRNTRLE